MRNKKISANTIILHSLLIAYLLFANPLLAQDCTTQAGNKASTLARGTDDIDSPTGRMNATEMAKMKPHLAKAEAWMKSKLQNFTGAKLLYSNNFFPDYLGEGTTHPNLFKATGIKSYYSSQMRFFAYYCYDNNNTIYIEGESGSNVMVVFNNFFNLDLTQDAGVYNLNGKPVFRILEKERSEGRMDFYDLRKRMNYNDTIRTSKSEFIIIRNSDKPVFIPVSRKEFLQQMLLDLETYRTKQKALLTEISVAQVKQFEHEITVKKQYDKNYTPEKEAKERKNFLESNNPEKENKDFRKIDDNVNASKEVVGQYLKKPAEWLERGFDYFYPYSEYTAKGLAGYFDKMDVPGESREDLTPSEVVRVNPEYFNKSLSSDIPQLIIVVIRNKTYNHMQKVAKLLSQANDFAPLNAIINPGKTAAPIAASPEPVSNYVLTYLKKLKNLSPLVVPAGMKSSVEAVVNVSNPAPATPFNFTIPSLSPKLKLLPAALTKETYQNYLEQLYVSISSAMKPAEKKKADDYLKNKNLNQSKEIGKSALGAWIQNAPAASLYLFCKAVKANSSDAQTANNFSAFLIMGGLSEKSIPILEYWNRQKTGEPSVLSNLGNAYFRLGAVDQAIKYLQQCVQVDSLNPTAHKILCMIYLKKGDLKKAEEHGTKSLTGSHDEQVVAILKQLNPKTKPGEIMSRFPASEFPMLKRMSLPALPSKLDDMAKFKMDWEAEIQSLEITIADIENKMPQINDDIKQKFLMATLTRGISPLRMKAQYIIMDAMQTYQREAVRENEVFKYQHQLILKPYSEKVKAIVKKYNEQLGKLEGGEAGDEDQIAALELAKCREVNAEKEKYLAALSTVVNSYAQRQEFISRRFHRDYANWAPYWMPEINNPFPSIERDYLKDLLGILKAYPIIQKENCTPFEPLPKKEGKLQKWEEEYCVNFKGKISFGPGKMTWTCSSWGIEGGEGIVGEMEINYADDGAFQDFTLGAGFGENWTMGEYGIAKLETSASIKEFIKIGRNKATKEFEVKDFGLKTELTVEGTIGKASAEVKMLEFSGSINAGITAGGLDNPVLNIN